MSEPEKMCPRCGCGMESGWEYPACAEFPTAEERFAAHRALCHRFALDVCGDCSLEISPETA